MEVNSSIEFGLTKALAKELAPRGIRVNAIAPGFIQTDMTKDLNTEKIVEHIPLKKLGTPEDIAKTVKFLAEDAPYTFLYVPDSNTALSKRFRNINPAPAGISYNFIDWYVPKEEQKYYFVVE